MYSSFKMFFAEINLYCVRMGDASPGYENSTSP